MRRDIISDFNMAICFIVLEEFILSKENIMAITLSLDCKPFFLCEKVFISFPWQTQTASNDSWNVYDVC